MTSFWALRHAHRVRVQWVRKAIIASMLPPLIYAVLASVFVFLFRDYPFHDALSRIAKGVIWIAAGLSPFVLIGAIAGVGGAKVETSYRRRDP
jgi:ABC-type transport system involved in cytochrome c biogenesis permease component